MAKPEGDIPARSSADSGPFDELLDMDGELFEAGVWSSLDQKEGLPTRYAMRHDAHYVDELVSAKGVRQVIRVPVKHIEARPDEPSDIQPLAKSIAEFGVLQPLLVRRRRGRYEIISGAKRLAAAKAAGLTEVPCLLYDVDEPLAQRMQEATNLRREADAPSDNRARLNTVFPLLGQSLHTLLSCLRLLETSGPQGNRVTRDLIHAEAERAAQLTWGATLIGFVPKLVLNEFDGADVFEEVVGFYEKQHPLSELNFVKRIHGPCNMRADKRLVSVAMRGAVDAMLPLARSRRKPTVLVRLARHTPSRHVVFQVSQSVLRPPDSAWNRWFDLGWRDRPGGIASGVGLLAAKRVTELHGGRLAIAPGRDSGCHLTLWFPEAASGS